MQLYGKQQTIVHLFVGVMFMQFFIINTTENSGIGSADEAQKLKDPVVRKTIYYDSKGLNEIASVTENIKLADDFKKSKGSPVKKIIYYDEDLNEVEPETENPELVDEIQKPTSFVNDIYNQMKKACYDDPITCSASIISGAVMGALGLKLLLQENVSDSLATHAIRPVIVKDTTLRNYAGLIPPAVETLVDQIKNREAYKKVNAPVTKGVLLTGLPGTGKSFLARAIAGEVGCPFYATSAAEFNQPYVGAGELMIRDMFRAARLAAAKDPSKLAIIFVDEIDAIGARDATYSGGSPIATLQTFLTEMDGFNKAVTPSLPWYKRIFSRQTPQSVDVVILAATNTPDKLDPALKRKGRFDHIIEVKNPDESGRQAIAALYLKRYPHDTNVRADKIAQLTEGMSPADINAFFGEAARDAGSKKQITVGIANFCHAILEAKKSGSSAQATEDMNADNVTKIFNLLKGTQASGVQQRELGTQEILHVFVTMYPGNESVTVGGLMQSPLGSKTEQEIATIFEDAYKKSQAEKRVIEMSDLVANIN